LISILRQTFRAHARLSRSGCPWPAAS